MTVSGMTAEYLLGVSHLIHAQPYQGVRKLNNASKSLADLIGQDQAGDWHVIEAKARTAAPSNADKLRWKAQAGTISHINLVPIATGSYCYATLTTALVAGISDPPPNPGRPVNLTIDPASFGRDYYLPFIEFLNGNTRNVERMDRSFTLRIIALDPLAQDYVYVGLDDRILRIPPGSDISFRDREIDDEDLFVGKDGIAFMTSSGPCDA